MTIDLDIAQRLNLISVMDELTRRRPVFHSEADFQHAFGQVVHDLDPSMQVRLEVRQEDAEYLDLLCFTSQARTAIEFKYATRAWQGSDGITDELFRLRGHAAMDLARLGFVSDIARLERFCAVRPDTNGLAVMLTNDPSLWALPRSPRRTRDYAFRIHEGVTLAGELLWAEGSFPANTRLLRGPYRLAWRDFSNVGGEAFKWLAVAVEPPRTA